MVEILESQEGAFRLTKTRVLANRARKKRKCPGSPEVVAARRHMARGRHRDRLVKEAKDPKGRDVYTRGGPLEELEEDEALAGSWAGKWRYGRRLDR